MLIPPSASYAAPWMSEVRPPPRARKPTNSLPALDYPGRDCLAFLGGRAIQNQQIGQILTLKFGIEPIALCPAFIDRCNCHGQATTLEHLILPA